MGVPESFRKKFMEMSTEERAAVLIIFDDIAARRLDVPKSVQELQALIAQYVEVVKSAMAE